MTLVTKHAALSDIGLHRVTNEDSFVAAPPLFVVCDGMGGAEAGEVASALAAETLVTRVAAGEGLAAAAMAANEAVYARASERVEETGMGTTLTAVVVAGAEARFVHVGDSRAYLLRDRRLEVLSQDHSLVGEMVREGRLTWDEAAAHPHRSILSRALGTEPSVQVDEFSVGLREGDVLLLCSDGLSGAVTPEVLRDRLAAGDPAEAARGLVAAALAAGGHDNVTVVVIRIEADADGDAGDQADVAAEATTRVTSVPTGTGLGEAAGETSNDGLPADAARVSASAPGPSPPPGSRRSRRRLVVLVVALALIALVGVAGVIVVNTCYFVGVDDGRLAVYSGLPWSVGPLDLNSVYLKSSRSYAMLDASQRQLVDARSIHTKDGALRLATDLGMLP